MLVVFFERKLTTFIQILIASGNLNQRTWASFTCCQKSSPVCAVTDCLTLPPGSAIIADLYRNWRQLPYLIECDSRLVWEGKFTSAEIITQHHLTAVWRDISASKPSYNHIVKPYLSYMHESRYSG